MKKIIIAASGTGGHIYPGIAVAEELKELGCKPVFFLSNNTASAQIIKNSGFNYITLNMSGMPRKLSFSFIKFCFNTMFSIFVSIKYILKNKPDAVLGMGGYLSVPVIIAGKLLGKRTYIHEQNSIPGVANRFLNRFCSETFISFQSSEKYFKKKNLFFTGYPIRKDILSVTKEQGVERFGLEKDIFTVLIFGGSLGAAKLNEIAFDAMELITVKEKIQILHITGNKNYEEIKAKAEGKRYYHVFNYMHDIAYAYAAADIVICRSGAGTVFELIVLNKPAVLVPYPYAADNHQLFNAKEIEHPKKTRVIEEKDLSSDILKDVLIELKNSEKTKEKKEKYIFPQEIIAEKILKDCDNA